jgi:hypothetical protein
MSAPADSIPHETRTAADPRQDRLILVRIAHVEQVNAGVRLFRLALPDDEASKYNLS